MYMDTHARNIYRAYIHTCIHTQILHTYIYTYVHTRLHISCSLLSALLRIKAGAMESFSTGGSGEEGARRRGDEGNDTLQASFVRLSYTCSPVITAPKSPTACRKIPLFITPLAPVCYGGAIPLSSLSLSLCTLTAAATATVTITMITGVSVLLGKERSEHALPPAGK